MRRHVPDGSGEMYITIMTTRATTDGERSTWDDREGMFQDGRPSACGSILYGASKSCRFTSTRPGRRLNEWSSSPTGEVSPHSGQPVASVRRSDETGCLIILR